MPVVAAVSPAHCSLPIAPLALVEPSYTAEAAYLAAPLPTTPRDRPALPALTTAPPAVHPPSASVAVSATSCRVTPPAKPRVPQGNSTAPMSARPVLITASPATHSAVSLAPSPTCSPPSPVPPALLLAPPTPSSLSADFSAKPARHLVSHAQRTPLPANRVKRGRDSPSFPVPAACRGVRDRPMRTSSISVSPAKALVSTV
jgi:hypothetical protein